MCDLDSDFRICEICETSDCGPLYIGVGQDCWITSLVEGVQQFEDLPEPLLSEMLERRFTITGLEETTRVVVGAHRICDQIQAVLAAMPNEAAEIVFKDMMWLVLDMEAGTAVELKINDQRVATIGRDE